MRLVSQDSEHKFAALYDMNIGKVQQTLNTKIPIYFGNDASLFGLGEELGWSRSRV